MGKSIVRVYERSKKRIEQFCKRVTPRELSRKLNNL